MALPHEEGMKVAKFQLQVFCCLCRLAEASLGGRRIRRLGSAADADCLNAIAGKFEAFSRSAKENLIRVALCCDLMSGREQSRAALRCP
jgi:hypothetical protein